MSLRILRHHKMTDFNMCNSQTRCLEDRGSNDTSRSNSVEPSSFSPISPIVLVLEESSTNDLRRPGIWQIVRRMQAQNRYDEIANIV